MSVINPTENPRRAYEQLATPDQVPLYDLVPVRGPQGEIIEAYRGVQRRDTRDVVSVVSSKYSLVQHRTVANAVHLIGAALEKPVLDAGAPSFPREQIRLFAQGRRMEVRLVVGTRYDLSPQDSVFPGVRVMNSLDGSWAVRAEGTGVRVCCANQLYAGQASLVELRELHLASANDLLGMLQKAIYAILGRFKDALKTYEASMHQEILAEDVEPALVAAGLPRIHASAIGTRAEVEATHVGLLSKWSAYQCATAYLTHGGVDVNPERARMFERAAASALLLPAGEAALA